MAKETNHGSIFLIRCETERLTSLPRNTHTYKLSQSNCTKPQTSNRLPVSHSGTSLSVQMVLFHCEQQSGYFSPSETAENVFARTLPFYRGFSICPNVSISSNEANMKSSASVTCKTAFLTNHFFKDSVTKCCISCQ